MKIEAIDITIATPFKGEGVAYYRLPDDLVKFLELCHEKHRVAGFEWDSESPRNFGVILGRV